VLSDHAIVERYFTEMLNAADFTIAADILTADFLFYGPLTPEGVDTDGLRDFTLMLRAAFPDKHFTVLESFKGKDAAAIFCRFRMTGTHKGFFQGVPPTGKSIDVEGAELFTIQDGRIAQARAYFDLITIMTQIGMMPRMTLSGIGVPKRTG
jgi:steroid delta-isomerase-like uncharacterized protein